MEEGLIVIGDRNDFIEKTSYGHFAITVPATPPHRTEKMSVGVAVVPYPP